jgi:hypothetical protein
MGMEASLEERRGDSRKKVDLLLNRFLNGYPYLCRATDISRSGIRLVPILHEPEPRPRYVGIQLQLPGSDEIITAAGEIVSNDNEETVGVRFTRLPANGAAMIDRYVGGLAEADLV